MISSSTPILRNLSFPDLLPLTLWVLLAGVSATNHHHLPPFFLWSVVGGAFLIVRQVAWGGVRGNLTVALVVPVFIVLSMFAMKWVTRMTPNTLDALLLEWDFGVAAAVRSWAVASPFMPAINVAYDALPCAVMLAVAATSGARRSRLLWAVGLGGVLAVPCYMLFPAVGPIHLANPNAERNCMPSMHLTWALLLAVHLEGRAQWAAWIFAAITALATLATGEHYLPDLIAALPWTAFLTLLASQILSKLQGASRGTSRAKLQSIE